MESKKEVSLYTEDILKELGFVMSKGNAHMKDGKQFAYIAKHELFIDIVASDKWAYSTKSGKWIHSNFMHSYLEGRKKAMPKFDARLPPSVIARQIDELDRQFRQIMERDNT